MVARSLQWGLLWDLRAKPPTSGQGQGQKNFQGGPIRIKLVLTSKMEELLKFGRFERVCENPERGHGPTLPPLLMPMPLEAEGRG